MKRLGARLKRAEARAKIGAPCAHCRLSLLSTWPGFDGRAAQGDSKDERLLVQCHFCETQYSLTIPATWPKWKRYVVRFVNTHKEDDFYTDRKACAVKSFYLYHHYRVRLKREAREKLREVRAQLSPDLKPSSYKSSSSHHSTPEKPLTPKDKQRQALIDEYVADVQRERREMLKKYGRRFPDVDKLVGQLANAHLFYYSHMQPNIEGDSYLKHLRAWATLESEIWGQPLASTVKEIAAHTHALEKLAAAVIEKEQKVKEERERRDREYKERMEAERLRRLGVARAASPASEHPLWNEKAGDASATSGSDVISVPFVFDDPAEWVERHRTRRDDESLSDARHRYASVAPVEVADLYSDPKRGMPVSDSTQPGSVQPVTIPDVQTSKFRPMRLNRSKDNKR
ncbi:MAG TPA: hypothetical protein VGB73_18840 [Pyrinomonadaceae bacterium]|jgi:hypothetical protein